MPTYAATTIASKRYLAHARVTAGSFRRHNPGIPFITLLADEADDVYDAAREPFETLPIAELSIDNLRGFEFQYTELELSYAATPFFIDYVLGQGYDGVLFLKQETLVRGSLAPEFDLLSSHSVVLTPHLLEPPSGPYALDLELDTLRAGIYNCGFIGFNNSAEARQALRWWQRKTRRGCFRAVEQGVHYEQRWLDFFPCLAPGCHILRDPAVNIGHWNLMERQAYIDDCRVFRFSGYDPDSPHMVTRYNSRTAVENSGAARAIFHCYQAAIMAAGYRDCQARPYAFAAFDDGTPISDAARRMYHDLDGAAQQFGDPFCTACPGNFRRWLTDPTRASR